MANKTLKEIFEYYKEVYDEGVEFRYNGNTALIECYAINDFFNAMAELKQEITIEGEIYNGIPDIVIQPHLIVCEFEKIRRKHYRTRKWLIESVEIMLSSSGLKVGTFDSRKIKRFVVY